MDGELIRDDAHHASAKHLIISQYLLLDSEFMEAAWGGQAPCCLPPLGSVLEQHEVSSVQLRVIAETVECKGLLESCWRLPVCVA